MQSDKKSFVTLTVRALLAGACAMLANLLATLIGGQVNMTDPLASLLSVMSIVSLIIGFVLVMWTSIRRKSLLNGSAYVIFVAGFCLCVFGASLQSSIYPAQFVLLK
jgi:hypothetical protein